VATQNQKIHGIIHIASLACGAVGLGLAQVPGSDSVAIVPLQGAMIVAIASEHGITVGKTVAADLVLTFAATVAGRTISQVVVGWIPGIGNVVNALTAAALTEAVGWAASEYFEKQDMVSA
jgi:uncharacterized protein (DUF697 family)